jgi:hypothetical protein
LRWANDAIERRHHALIRLELQQYLKLGLLGTDVCLRDSDRSLLRPQVQPFCVCLLTRDPALACQIAVAVPGDARDLRFAFAWLSAASLTASVAWAWAIW